MDLSNVLTAPVPKNFNEIWRPIGMSQVLAMNCPANELLFHGTRGSGKTDVSLMRFRRMVGIGYGEFLRGMIIDVQYSALDDIIARAKRWFSKFDDGSKFYSSKTDYKYVWKDGAELLFRAIATEEDYANKAHGMELSYISFNELTKHKNLDVYDSVATLNRTSFVPSDYPLRDGSLLPELPLTIFSTTNSFGVGKNAVKKRFIDVSNRGEIYVKKFEIFNPRTQQTETLTRTQCHLFSSYKENTKIAPDYVAQLESIEDPMKRAAFVLGSWDYEGDGAYFGDVWDRHIHVVEPFDIPSTWTIDRAFDYGDSAPSSIGYFAESDGCDITLNNGKIKSTVKGDIYHIGEIYTCQEGYPHKGVRMLPSDLAKLILEYELSTGIHDRVKPGAADTAIFAPVAGHSIAGYMSQPITIGNTVYKGISWKRVEALKKAGSRKDGLIKIKERLQNAIVTKDKPYRDKPALFVFNTCKYFIEIVPTIERDEKKPDDIDGTIDHIVDMCRYKLLSMDIGVKSGKTKGLT